MSIKLNKRSLVIDDLIRTKLEDGVMPSSSEILDTMLDPENIRVTSSPTDSVDSWTNGNLLSSKRINEMLDGIEADSIAMRMTLDDAWNELKMTINKAYRSVPFAHHEADLITAVATRAISLFPEADGVRVGTEALSVSAGVGLGRVSGADMKLSRGVEIDQQAGTLTLARTSISPISATSDPMAWSVSGEYNLRTEKVIGNPTWSLANSLAKTWTVVVTSPSNYGRVTLSAIYDIPTEARPLKRVELVLPDSSETQVDIYIDFDGLGNYEFWERASGKGRIVVDGRHEKVSRVRIEMSRYVANDSFFKGASKHYEYAFQVSEIQFMASAYVAEGSVVSDPIPMSYESVVSLNVDVDALIPSTSSVSSFIARDVTGATDLEDFSWIPVDDKAKMSAIVKTSIETEFILCQSPQKVRTGAGVYSNSIYSIGKPKGVLVSVDEGHDQFELRKLTVQTDTEGNVPDLSSVGFLTATPEVVNRADAVLTGANFYQIKTSIFSDAQTSKSLIVGIEDTAEVYRVIVNGSDVTNRLSDGQTSISLFPGENTLMILVSTGSTAKNVNVSVSPMDSCVFAIARPTIVNELKLNGTASKMAQTSDALLINHDPKGRNFRVSYRETNGISMGAVRLRVALKRGMGGESPQIKRAFVTTGV